MSAPHWAGSVLADGFVFDEALLGRRELLRRLEVAWSDGARLAHAGNRWYLVGAARRRVDSRQSPGAPLVHVEGRWLAGPRSEAQVRDAPLDAVLECVAGRWRSTPWGSLSPQHPGALIELPLPPVLEVHTLAPAPRPLPGPAAPDPSLEALFAPMLRALGPAASPPPPSLWARLRARLRPSPAPPAAGGLDGPANAPPPPRPAAGPPGFVARALARLFAARNARAQQHYLADLQERFARGDLGEALRRAVPLSSGTAPGPAGPPTGALPERRASLGLLGAPAAGPPAMVLPGDQFAQMKKLYREAADRLIAEGKIEEAAFVLSNLLNDARAAVALLESHGQLELAAQLATAQRLPELERIRLWLLAGRTAEAVSVARRSQNFASLVSALTSRSPQLARRLRAVWGDFLAGRQRFAEALAVTAALEEAPEAWPRWLERALEVGGASAVTALAVDVSRHPEHARHTRTALEGLLDEEPALAAGAAEALLTHAPGAPAPVYRELWRRLMRDAGAGGRVDQRLVERVLASTSDASLVADAVPPVARPRANAGPLELPAPVVDQLPAADFAPLPKGRRALAHGAAGLRIVDSRGAVLRHLLVKADQLVVGPVGSPVLVLSLDGALTHVWKLDPLTFELTSWFQASRLEVFAPRFDGLSWAVGLDDALVLLDPGAAQAMEWWRYPGLTCRAVDALGPHVFASGTEVSGAAAGNTLVFHASEQRLVQRLAAVRAAYSAGAVLAWHLTPAADGAVTLSLPPSGRSRLLPHGPWATLVTEQALVLTRVDAGATEVWQVDWARLEVLRLARLAGTVRARCRALGEGKVGLCDEHGRLTELELAG